MLRAKQALHEGDPREDDRAGDARSGQCGDHRAMFQSIVYGGRSGVPLRVALLAHALLLSLGPNDYWQPRAEGYP
jgi:hypothetical protein